MLNLEHKESQKILRELQHQDNDFLDKIKDDIQEIKEMLQEKENAQIQETYARSGGERTSC